MYVKHTYKINIFNNLIFFIMKFKRTINVNGTVNINNIDVNFNFNYENGISPEIINFQFVDDVTSVYGNLHNNKFYYTVDGGIVTNELMTLIATECTSILTNYETV